MSEVTTETLDLPDDARQRPPRVKVVVHRLDGGLEDGESDARTLTSEGFPLYSGSDSQRARLVPTRDIKYVVFGSVDDPTLEADPGEKSTARKAILRFRDGEWIAAYIEQGVQPDAEGIAIKIRLAELQRTIPAVAASPSLLEMQFVDMWATPTPGAQPQRRRSDILEAAARQGRDLNKLANDFRDRLALIRDVGLTTGDTLAFSRAVRTHLDRFLLEDGISLNSQEKSALADIILRAAVGYGPLDSLLHDRSVSEIMVNGPDQIFIERRGVLTKADVRFEDENQLLETIRRMVATTGRHIDGLNPMVDARLPDGSRVNIIIPPLALDGASVSIRKFSKKSITLDTMAAGGSISPAMATVLKIAARCRLNILISGGTGSGKTTLLNALSRMIDGVERTVTIEDAAELQLQQPHVVRLETRTANLEGTGEINMRDLLKNALRMRPDRIIIGECRGEEALDMLQAMNTGHDGSMSTVHANSPREALTRLENMIGMAGINLPSRAVRTQIASAIHMICQVNRMRDGQRRVTHLMEVVGMEGDIITTQELFTYQFQGEGSDGKLRGNFQSSGIRPAFLPRAEYFGLDRALLEVI